MDLSFTLDTLNSSSADTDSKLLDVENMLGEGVTWDFNPETGQYSLIDLATSFEPGED